ncbi:hypothetical protein M409DRAFT_22151 [Zasmidium cellare ATCC 36951]|uniref:Uncharacterized protein n=1 Tax=Zasmidium cellare ATCC 36951 TaxID=1080233 RepID=A0A6A6CN50_ZASCE|nr:uncharacterized protein M409DRAFT_22151 [Zasmidium cellare ATCC 36951]KAF2167342.1 hypothetical protein M409DRAFT_22151 [Zasmidium cellare ATCC 36951]
MMLTSDPVFAKDDIAREVLHSKNNTTYETKNNGKMFVANNHQQNQEQGNGKMETTDMRESNNENHQPEAERSVNENKEARGRNERLGGGMRMGRREMVD